MRVRNEKGGSLVEFAIILPILLIIIFGIIEFGVLLFDKAMITNASREGARAGIVFNFDPSGPTRISDGEITSIVRAYCEQHVVSLGGGSGLDIPLPVRTGSQEGASLTVTVNYQYRFLVLSNLMALFGDDIASPLNLHAVTVMRLE